MESRQIKRLGKCKWICRCNDIQKSSPAVSKGDDIRAVHVDLYRVVEDLIILLLCSIINYNYDRLKFRSIVLSVQATRLHPLRLQEVQQEGRSNLNLVLR